MKKVVSIVLAIMLVATCTVAFAKDGSAYMPNQMKPNAGNTAIVENVGNDIYGIVRTVGTIVAVIWLVILGIKYMMGSAEEKAEYKKTFIPYIVGAVLIFAASNLAQMIAEWATNFGAKP